jgi:hypothetical protein
MAFSAEAQDLEGWELDVIAGQMYHFGAIYTLSRLVTVSLPGYHHIFETKWAHVLSGQLTWLLLPESGDMISIDSRAALISYEVNDDWPEILGNKRILEWVHVRK